MVALVPYLKKLLYKLLIQEDPYPGYEETGETREEYLKKHD